MMSDPALTSSPYQLAEEGSVKRSQREQRERRNLDIRMKRQRKIALEFEPFHLS